MAAVVLLGLTLSWPSSAGSSWGDKLQRSPFSSSSPVPPARSLWIGVLEGTWREMGIQYGERAGKDIASHWDFDWEDRAVNSTSAWAKNKTPEERQAYRVAYLKRAWKELSYFSPELCEFMEGMAEGAAKELDKCYYDDICPHYLKILYLHESEPRAHPNWDFERDRPASLASGTTGADLITSMAEHGEGDDGCNALWVTGEATSTGHTYAQRAVQGGLSRSITTVAYIAIPTDPNARVFWGHGRAGTLGGIGGGLMNDAGLCVLTAGAQYADADAVPDETLAPGIKDFVLGAYGVIFSKTAREAALKMAIGTPEYRALTGRQTVLRHRGANVMFCDPEEAYVVESNARNYFIRKPGDLGEKDGNYLVMANHFKSTAPCFTDNNVPSATKSMSDYCPETEGSSKYRFWTGMWMIKNNYGKIDLEMIRDVFASAHTVYDENGVFFDVDPKTGMQKAKPGTWCAHSGPYSEDSPLGKDGNHMTSVFDLTTREVWWVPGWTCHYREWNMDWHYVNLKPYAEYRKLRLGY